MSEFYYWVTFGESTPTRTEDGGFGDRCFTTKL